MKIGYAGSNRLMITNDKTNRLVHKWRSEEAAIMAGTNTVMFDDPKFTNRLWSGYHPVRIVIDLDLRLPSSLNVFDGSVRTIVFNALKHEENVTLSFYQVTRDVSLVHQVLNGLYSLRILSVMIEGGARLLQSFIDEGSWDEARVLTNSELVIGSGVSAPQLTDATLHSSHFIDKDEVRYFLPYS
jgi:diaminohydroxyphosphoribosylaminopyrimidine deaminase/5-amino-6-(5-phosphoribosylamino)uracil reductase